MPSFSVLAESEGFYFGLQPPLAAMSISMPNDCKHLRSDFALVSQSQTRSASARNS